MQLYSSLYFVLFMRQKKPFMRLFLSESYYFANLVLNK